MAAQSAESNAMQRAAARGKNHLRSLKEPLGSLWLALLRAWGVEIGPRAWVAFGSHVEAGTRIVHDARINGPISIRGAGRATIGAFSAVGRDVTILTENHATHLPNMQFRLHTRLGLRRTALVEGADVVVGPASWIGDRAIVLPGVTIGAGAVIGAGAIVSRDVAPYTVAAGVPARHIRDRCPAEVRDLLLELAWWEWSPERLQRNTDFLSADITSVDREQLAALVVP